MESEIRSTDPATLSLSSGAGNRGVNQTRCGRSVSPHNEMNGCYPFYAERITQRYVQVRHSCYRADPRLVTILGLRDKCRDVAEI